MTACAVNSAMHVRMRRHVSQPAAVERSSAHSLGESSESSPSWASGCSVGNSSATPNLLEQDLAFDFSRRCELDGLVNEDHLLSPKYTVPVLRTSRSSEPLMTTGSLTPSSTSASPSPIALTPSPSPEWQTKFQFPSIRRRKNSGDVFPALNGSRSMFAASPSRSVNNVKSAHSSSTRVSSGGKLSRLLRRTQSAGCSNDVPAYALFLRHKPAVSKESLPTQSSGGRYSDTEDDNGSRRQKKRSGIGSDMKLRLGFLRRRHTDSTISSVRPPPEEAKKWSISFTDLMANKYGQSLFRAFLQREYCEENMEFWLAIEDFKKSRPQKLSAKAQKIYNDYIVTQAPKEVNLDSTTREMTLNQLNNPTKNTFDQAQKRVQGLMERDAYQRFLQSELYIELVHPEKCTSSSASTGNSVP